MLSHNETLGWQVSSVVTCSAVQCRTVEFSTVQNIAVQQSKVQCKTVQYSSVLCSSMQLCHFTKPEVFYCALFYKNSKKKSELQCCGAQCNSVKCIEVQFSTHQYTTSQYSPGWHFKHHQFSQLGATIICQEISLKHSVSCSLTIGGPDKTYINWKKGSKDKLGVKDLLNRSMPV